MTEAKLESYIGLKKEIEQLKAYLKEGPPETSDVVVSAASFPYSKHAVGISGVDVRLYDAWRARLADNQRAIEEIERFVEDVPDATVRLAMRYRYYNDLPWQTVAMRCGWQDKNTPLNQIRKYLSTPPHSPKPPL